MARNTAGTDDRIDSSHLDGSTDHTPEGIDIAECQAEHNGQQCALEVSHLDISSLSCGKRGLT
jgi:hypothetical protein